MNRLLSLLIILLYCCGCREKADPSVTAGKQTIADYFNYNDTGVQSAGIRMIPIKTPVGNFRVWTKRFGNNPRIKVLLLHGGPALTHEYMECFESFFPKEGFEFYEYDQLGSYYSDQPKDSSLWTIDHFVDEVEQVRIALGMDNTNFYLLGNSWGSILGIEYALKYQQNLKGLILGNMQASIPRYEAYNKVLRSQMRQSFLDSVNVYETKGNYQDPVYQEMVFREYYTKHLCRLPEWPDPVLRSFKHVNSEVYVMMQGPSEFKVGGRLLSWDRWNDLKNISVPTLMIGAKFDTMDPEDMRKQSEMVQQGRYLFCPKGSHLAMWDDQQVYMNGVINFIRDVDGGNFKKG